MTRTTTPIPSRPRADLISEGSYETIIMAASRAIEPEEPCWDHPLYQPIVFLLSAAAYTADPFRIACETGIEVEKSYYFAARVKEIGLKLDIDDLRRWGDTPKLRRDAASLVF